jgi:muramoyltetrapeptide carboxypeptidase
MKFPPLLQPGDTVALVSPSGKHQRATIERGAAILREQGYKVRIGRHAFDEKGIFAGTDRARSADMQKALDDPAIKAIFFSRGGYGCIRTHEGLDWSKFLTNPKWIVGFSDITVFHAFLARHKIASLHSVMTGSFEADGTLTPSFLRLMEILRGDLTHFSHQEIPPHPLNRPGTASGILTGGNLSILQSLRGTPLDIRPKGKILFIEDLNELYYHLDRMLRNLKAGGILQNLSGLIVGHFTGMKDGAAAYGQTAAEIIREAVADYDYPVLFNYPAGHELPNDPILLGAKVEINITRSQASLAFRGSSSS